MMVGLRYACILFVLLINISKASAIVKESLYKIVEPGHNIIWKIKIEVNARTKLQCPMRLVNWAKTVS